MDFDAFQSDSDSETEPDMEISEMIDTTIHIQGQQSKEIPSRILNDFFHVMDRIN